MLKVGLTGGIGSGKSTVAEMFSALGAALIDTDVIAHTLSQPSALGAQAVLGLFGSDYLSSDGSINRTKLRQRVFQNPEDRHQLEAALHPLIRAEAERQLNQIDRSTPYCIIAVPLLFEHNAFLQLVNRTLAIDCDDETQIKRVMARNNLSEIEVRAIIAAQMPNSQRIKLADDTISNKGDLSQLHRQVIELDKRFRIAR